MVLLRVGRLQYMIARTSMDGQTTKSKTQTEAANEITFTDCSETRMISLSSIVVKLLRVQRLVALALSVQEALPPLWQPVTLQEVFLTVMFSWKTLFIKLIFLTKCFQHISLHIFIRGSCFSDSDNLGIRWWFLYNSFGILFLKVVLRQFHDLI